MAAQVASKRRVSRFGPILIKLERREALWFWFFISPWVVGFILFTADHRLILSELDELCSWEEPPMGWLQQLYLAFQ